VLIILRHCLLVDCLGQRRITAVVYGYPLAPGKLALIAVGLDEAFAAMTAPVLADSKVNADRRFWILSGANLVGIRPRFHVEPALEAAGVIQRDHQDGS